MTNQAQTVTGMTYDGNAMTLISSLAPAGNNHQYVYSYGGTLSTASKNVVISFSSALAFFDATVMTLSGSSTANPTNVTTAHTESNVTSFSGTAITTTVANAWVIDSVAVGSNASGISSTSSSTIRIQSQIFDTAAQATILKASTGSYTAGYSGPNNNWSIISFEVTPATAAAATNAAFLLNFV